MVIFLRILMAGMLLITAGTVSAGQFADMVCVKYRLGMSDYGSNTIGGDNCEIYELRVTVTSDADAGQPGAFGIGAQLNSGAMAYWTAAGGWGAFKSGLVPPVDGYYPALPASQTYVVFHGSLASMCEMSGRQNFRVYAAHGILTAQKGKTVQDLQELTTNITADHMRRVFIQMDATARNSGKAGLVYTHDCSGIFGAY